MTSILRGFGALLLTLSTACVTSTSNTVEKPPVPPPNESQMQILGVDASVQLAAAFAQARGYDELKLQEVTQPTAGLVKVRFGLLPKNGKWVLDLEVDRSLRKVVKAEETDGVSAKVLETP